LNETEARVNISSYVNVYSYNQHNLIFTYAATCALSLLGVMIGFIALIRNGVSYENSFSAFMLTTRNRRLDELAIGHSMGAMPLDDKLKKEELRFGLLQGGNLRRVGFGTKDEVVPLRKGEPYY
jgi:hypothetical protein